MRVFSVTGPNDVSKVFPAFCLSLAYPTSKVERSHRDPGSLQNRFSTADLRVTNETLVEVSEILGTVAHRLFTRLRLILPSAGFVLFRLWCTICRALVGNLRPYWSSS